MLRSVLYRLQDMNRVTGRSQSGFSLIGVLVGLGILTATIAAMFTLLQRLDVAQQFAKSRIGAGDFRTSLIRMMSSSQFGRCNFGGSTAGIAALRIDKSNIPEAGIQLSPDTTNSNKRYLRSYNEACDNPKIIAEVGQPLPNEDSGLVVSDIRIKGISVIDDTSAIGNLIISWTKNNGGSVPAPTEIKNLQISLADDETSGDPNMLKMTQAIFETGNTGASRRTYYADIAIQTKPTSSWTLTTAYDANWKVLNTNYWAVNDFLALAPNSEITLTPALSGIGVSRASRMEVKIGGSMRWDAVGSLYVEGGCWDSDSYIEYNSGPAAWIPPYTPYFYHLIKYFQIILLISKDNGSTWLPAYYSPEFSTYNQEVNFNFPITLSGLVSGDNIAVKAYFRFAQRREIPNGCIQSTRFYDGSVEVTIIPN